MRRIRIAPRATPSRRRGVGQRRAMTDLLLGGSGDRILRLRFLPRGRGRGSFADRRPPVRSPTRGRSSASGGAATGCRRARPPEGSTSCTRKMLASVAPHSLAAFSATASRTGWRSVGELEMTRRISLVAVCCSRASVRSAFRACSSASSRAFSMAMTAWSAKVSSRATCRSVKSSGSFRRSAITPTAEDPRIRGTERTARTPRLRAISTLSGNSATSAERSATWTVTPSSNARPDAVPRTSGRENSPRVPRRHRPVVGGQHEPVAVGTVDGGVDRFAQPGRARRDRLEHRLKIGRRSADHPQDLAGRGLLVPGLGERLLEPGALRPHLAQRGLEGLDHRGELGVGLWRHRSTLGGDWGVKIGRHTLAHRRPPTVAPRTPSRPSPRARTGAAPPPPAP